MSTAETAVRSYLQWLDDPTSVRDHAAIEEAKAAAEQAADPLDRLKALSTLQELEAGDGERFRADFVANAAEWAAKNSVTPEAFEQLGVPCEVLADAGLATESVRAIRKAGGRRTRVSPDTVRDSVPSGKFTIADLEAASGASTATVRKVISEMIAAGELRNLGPDREHSGRGRAPLLFSKI